MRCTVDVGRRSDFRGRDLQAISSGGNSVEVSFFRMGLPGWYAKGVIFLRPEKTPFCSAGGISPACQV